MVHEVDLERVAGLFQLESDGLDGDLEDWVDDLERTETQVAVQVHVEGFPDGELHLLIFRRVLDVNL